MDREEFRIDRVAKMDTVARNLLPEAEAAISSGDSDALLAAVAKEFAAVFADQPGFAIADTPGEAWNWFKKRIMPGIDAIKPTSVAETVAGWLGTAVVNGARVAAAEGSSKVWISRKDDKVRPFHVEADGQTVLWSDPFKVCGDVEVMFPGEPIGDPSCWINCRCVSAPASMVSSSEEVVEMAGLDQMADPAADEMLEDDFDPSMDDGLDDGLGDEELLGSELKWHGCLAPEGVMSGDGRMFSEGALSWRDLPLPLRWQEADTGGHDGAVTIATIDRIERRGNLLMGEGTFTDTDMADRAVGMIGEGALKGVSIDADSAELAESADEGNVEFAKGRIGAATLVGIPAFAEAYIALGPLPDGEEEMVTSDTTLADEDDVEFKSKAKAQRNDPRRNTGLPPTSPKPKKKAVPIPKANARHWPPNVVSLEDPETLAEDETSVGEFRDYDMEQRRRMMEKGQAMRPDGAFPIADVQDLKNAIQSIGRAKDPAAAKAHIKKRANTLGHSELLPDDWASDTETLARGPGWVTNPTETRRLHAYWTQPGHAGFSKVRWGTPGDFTRLRRFLSKYIPANLLNRVAAQWHHDALGYWPGEAGRPGNPAKGAHRGGFSGESVNLVAAALEPVSSTYFDDPQLDGPTPITVEGDHVYGHIAAWGTCHIGMKGVCVTPPRSNMDYAHFRLGAVLTEKGRVSVGHLTVGTGHAALSDGPQSAAAHYDTTGTVAADVAAGDDDHGIWVSGRVRPEATAQQVHALQAGAVSGDWRAIGGNLELIAALVVNVPGFPVQRPALAADAGEQISLVAAGVLERPEDPDVKKWTDLVVEEIARRDRVAARLKSSKQVINSERIAALQASVMG